MPSRKAWQASNSIRETLGKSAVAGLARRRTQGPSLCLPLHRIRHRPARDRSLANPRRPLDRCLDGQDKVISESARHLMIEFFPDSTEEQIAHVIQQTQGERQPPRPLPGFVALVTSPDEFQAVEELADDASICAIREAPEAVLEGKPVHYCPGPMTIAWTDRSFRAGGGGMGRTRQRFGESHLLFRRQSSRPQPEQSAPADRSGPHHLVALRGYRLESNSRSGEKPIDRYPFCARGAW